MNVRSVLAFREIGKGHNAMVTFAKIMNMPPPLTRRNFTRIQNKKLWPVIQQHANDSMTTSAFEVREICGNDDGGCGISLDGTSLNSVVTAISMVTKKCVDAEVISDKCQQCLKWAKKRSESQI